MNEKEFYIYLGNANKDRIRTRFQKDKGNIIDHPAEADNIPHGAAISFLNQGVKKKEKRSESSLQKKYVKVKRHFELL